MKYSISKLLIIPVVAIIINFSGCSRQDNSTSPSTQQQENLLSMENTQVQSVFTIQERHTPKLMENSDVVGTATGLTDDGRLAVLVFVKTEVSKSALNVPTTLEGIPVLVQVTGEFKAMKSGGGGVSHTAKQTPPIQLGTSGGWRHDLANGYCCGGTLGSLVSKGGAQYILSNYHVLEADIVNGGNSRVATAGDPVIQPALIDVSCIANNAQNVATLSGMKSLPGSNVDAAIAQVISGMVRTDGAILEVGTLSATTVSAALNQAVKKSGRTTGLTRSKVSGLNATVSVAYDNECAGGAAFTKTYTGQIVIANSGSKFLNSGDSGSLMVQDVTTSPKAVGLLFAGSSTSAIANPIGQVLSWAGATMVGN
ncbi:MAG: hypothetical protein KGZ58_13325 [Ignavibacteriales bacterium]|nr:hypothetical protein [Ignavibacteriales bacterium]